jgi:hypothetical protein
MIISSRTIWTTFKKKKVLWRGRAGKMGDKDEREIVQVYFM